MNLINNNFGLGQQLQLFSSTLSRGITKPNISGREIIMQRQLKEEIKQVKGYEELYSVSNYGYVISEAKQWASGKNNKRICKKSATILKLHPNLGGYLIVLLHKGGKIKGINLSCLVYDHFGIGKRNGMDINVDHKDENKLNNRIDNLQLLTMRENTSKRSKRKPKSSKYTGVCFHKRDKVWSASIFINKKQKYLGTFNSEYNAHLSYQKAIGELI